jgi:hypothetical protein
LRAFAKASERSLSGELRVAVGEHIAAAETKEVRMNTETREARTNKETLAVDDLREGALARVRRRGCPPASPTAAWLPDPIGADG